MSQKTISREMVELALDVESVCQGCRSRDSKECTLCKERLQAKFDELDLGGRRR